MFLLKKIIGPFFFPMPICIGISFLGLYFLWFTKKQMAGKILISLGICVLYLLSCRFASHLILNPLEKQYTSYHSEISSEFIVVLGGGGVFNSRIPVTSQLSSPSIVRLVEGIRIYRENPGSKLILTGRGVSAAMAETAKAIGIDGGDIIIESLSKDTKDEAKNVRQIVGNEPFILVTSASHLPRAMALFRKQGMNPHPAAAEHLIKKEQLLTPKSFYPGGGGLRKSERAFYEYLGALWAKLRGQT